MTNQVIVFGTEDFSALNYYYLTHDSPYDVVAFTVDEAYVSNDKLYGLPVVPFEKIHELYPPDNYRMSILLGFRNLNGLRAEKYSEAIRKGYSLISYISSNAMVWPDIDIGNNSYILGNSIVGPYAHIGDDVVVSAGSVIGHHSNLQDHCFVSASATLLGRVTVGQYCVVGASATILDGIDVAPECIVGAGALIAKNTEPGSVYVEKNAERLSKSSRELAPLLTWSQDLKRPRD